MKSSTSCPSWSRKYSATVNPVRATRARALGCFVLKGNDTSFNHLMVQVVSFTGSFYDSSEH